MEIMKMGKNKIKTLTHFLLYDPISKCFYYSVNLLTVYLLMVESHLSTFYFCTCKSHSFLIIANCTCN